MATIAFSADAGPESSAVDVYLVHSDGSGLVPLTTDGLLNSDAQWSPDGSRILYVRNRSDEVSPTEDEGIYTVSPDGTGRIQLTGHDFDGSPSWSPSGNQIVFVRDVALFNNEIFVMDANGANQTNISNNAADHAAVVVTGRQQDSVRQHPRWDVSDFRHGSGRQRRRTAHRVGCELCARMVA